MRNVLAVLSVVAFIAGPVLAAPLIMNPIKDTIMSNYHPGQADEEANVNQGAAPNYRSINSNYIGAYDFATHAIAPGNALNDWLVANGIGTTGAAVKTAIDLGQVQVEFGLAANSSMNNAAASLRTIDCLTDWKEGNGYSATPTNFAWTNLGGAATFWNPAQILPSEGTKLGKGWGPLGNQYFTDASYTTISTANLVMGASTNTYYYITLTSEGVRQLLDEPLNRGLYTSRVTQTSGKSWLRESSYQPQLVFTVVPEPATMCLLALGSMALLRRKR